MSKSKKKVSDKMLGVMIGIALTISAILAISTVSVSYAHGHDTMPMMYSMMNGGESVMDDSNGMMGCMPMMKNHSQIAKEEIDEMLKSMDKDGDGLCDYCGMSVETCRKMMSS